MVEIVACARSERTLKRHEPSLEDVRETLRHMLKSWLDEKLPRVVERMVEKSNGLLADANYHPGVADSKLDPRGEVEISGTRRKEGN